MSTHDGEFDDLDDDFLDMLEGESVFNPKKDEGDAEDDRLKKRAAQRSSDAGAPRKRGKPSKSDKTRNPKKSRKDKKKGKNSPSGKGRRPTGSKPSKSRNPQSEDDFEDRPTSSRQRLSESDLESGRRQLEEDEQDSLYIGEKDKVYFYRNRPKTGLREKLIYYSHLLTLILLPIILIVFLVATWQNQGLKDTLNSQIDQTYNPSMRERNADAGKAAIYAYYNGSVPPLSLAGNLSWPGSTDSSATFTEDELDAESGDSESSGGYDYDVDEDGGASSEAIGADAEVTAIVKNLYLANSSVQRRDGTDEEVRQDPAMEKVEEETLTYRGSYNGLDKNITVKILTPMSKPVTELTPADNLQPPILAATPTVSEPRATVTGAPGTDDPGTRGGDLKPLKSLPDQVQASIEDWTDSYAADDRGGLRNIVQDPRDRNYVGLIGGWSLKDAPKANWQYVRESDDLMVVGVSFTATQTIEVQESDVPMVTDQPQMMELLIDYANGGTPAVVAWGPSGSALHLKAFQNAVQDNEVPDAASEDGGGDSGGADSIPGNTDDEESSSDPSSSESPDDDTASISGNDDSDSSDPPEEEEDDFY